MSALGRIDRTLALGERQFRYTERRRAIVHGVLVNGYLVGRTPRRGPARDVLAWIRLVEDELEGR